MHTQQKLPNVLEQCALVSQAWMCSAHSSISERTANQVLNRHCKTFHGVLPGGVVVKGSGDPLAIRGLQVPLPMVA